MANHTDYSPLAQEVDPPGVSDVLADPDAPPIYYGEGRFSPPSSLSDDDYADQEKRLDPGNVERGSIDDYGEMEPLNVMREPGGLFLGKRVRLMCLRCHSHIIGFRSARHHYVVWSSHLPPSSFWPCSLVS